MSAPVEWLRERYQAPSCILDITGKVSSLGQITGRPALKRLRFRLRLLAPGTGVTLLELRGVRSQLASLQVALQEYLQGQGQLQPQGTVARPHLRPEGLTRQRLVLKSLQPSWGPASILLTAQQLADLIEVLTQLEASLDILPPLPRPRSWQRWTRLGAGLGAGAGAAAVAIALWPTLEQPPDLGAPDLAQLETGAAPAPSEPPAELELPPGDVAAGLPETGPSTPAELASPAPAPEGPAPTAGPQQAPSRPTPFPSTDPDPAPDPDPDPDPDPETSPAAPAAEGAAGPRTEEDLPAPPLRPGTFPEADFSLEAPGETGGPAAEGRQVGPAEAEAAGPAVESALASWRADLRATLEAQWDRGRPASAALTTAVAYELVISPRGELVVVEQLSPGPELWQLLPVELDTAIAPPPPDAQAQRVRLTLSPSGLEMRPMVD